MSKRDFVVVVILASSTDRVMCLVISGCSSTRGVGSETDYAEVVQDDVDDADEKDEVHATGHPEEDLEFEVRRTSTAASSAGSVSDLLLELLVLLQAARKMHRVPQAGVLLLYVLRHAIRQLGRFARALPWPKRRGP